MKYLYKQMLAFWLIISTVLLIVGVAFTQFTKNAVLNTNFEQMESYADAIQMNSTSAPENLFSSIKLTERALKNQQILFLAIDAEKEIQYPHEVSGSVPQFIDDSDWKQLKEGKLAVITKTIEAPTRTVGKLERSAVVMKPLFITNGNNTVFYGALAVIQPVAYLKNSMSELTSNLFKAFLISTIFALIISYLFAKFQVNRINRMRKATREIAEGHFNIHIDHQGKDELDELAADFNVMADSLTASQEEIERQEERRRQFMADAAHEMRTPLTTINGLLEGIAYKAIPADQEEKCVALMQNETNRLIRLVNENLDYEKIRTNQINLLIQAFDGHDVIAQIVDQYQGVAEEGHNQLTLETSESVTVTADYDRFVQVIVNIVQNSLQFTENGQISIYLEGSEKATIVRICDTGIGMSEEEQKNIWERYYKADASRRSTKHGESGLGLAIVQQIIKLHQGTIEVTSEKGMGTTFTVTFPELPVTVTSHKKTTNS